MGFCGTHLRPILQDMLKMSICNMPLKNTLVKSLPQLPGANELMVHVITTCRLYKGVEALHEFQWENPLILEIKMYVETNRKHVWNNY